MVWNGMVWHIYICIYICMYSMVGTVGTFGIVRYCKSDGRVT